MVLLPKLTVSQPSLLTNAVSETSKKNGNYAPKAEDGILTDAKEELTNVHASKPVGIDTRTTREGEIDHKLSQLVNIWAKQGQFIADESKLGKNSRGRKDPRVGHPPRNQVKTNWENKDIQGM